MYFFRADGNEKIGAGHLMRCLTIAQELAERVSGEQIVFLCADALSGEMAEKQGFSVRVLQTDYRHMEAELPVLKGMLEEEFQQASGSRKGAVFLVDSYFVTPEYLSALKELGFVALLDDLGRKPYPVDMVINYNAPAGRAHYERLYENRQVQLVIGSSFIPLRKQFQGKQYQVREKVEKVLITTGGGDVDNIAGKILERLYTPEIEFHLVVGQFNPHFQELKEKEGLGNVVIHSRVEDMAGLMIRADLVITAGGSTVYELAALGVPFICFSYAENQEALTEYIGERKLAGFAGAYHLNPEKTLENMKRLFQKWCKEKKDREACALAVKGLTDGQGAARLAEKLEEVHRGWWA